MKVIAGTIGIVVVGILFGGAVSYALDRQDAIDCHKWAAQADALPAFYLTPSQAQQCAAVGVYVNAKTQ